MKSSEDLALCCRFLCLEDVRNCKAVLAREFVYQKMVVVEYFQSSPDIFDTSSLSHHLLAFQLSAVKQRTQISNYEYEGSYSSGSFFLAPANMPISCDRQEPNELLLVAFDPTFLSNTAARIGQLNSGPVQLLSIPFSEDPQMASIGFSLKQEMENWQAGRSQCMESLINLLAVHLLRHYSLQQPKTKSTLRESSDTALSNILEYIEMHLDQELTLDILANQIQLSPQYFAQTFKQLTGTSPYQYVIQQRIERAQHLLLHSDDSIAQVSLKVGFQDQSRFTKMFRARVGVSPRQYRKVTLEKPPDQSTQNQPNPSISPTFA
jgi:AraC family transcriptional regulator